MKKLYRILMTVIGLLTSQSLLAQNEFITLWKTSTGEVTIPTNPQYPYAYDISWSKPGVSLPMGSDSNITDDYTISGLTIGDTIEVKISGIFSMFYMNNGAQRNDLIDIKQWGTGQWQSFENAFYGCNNLVSTATDNPDLTQVYSTAGMFKDATLFNSNISNWNVTNITDMNSMFANATSFNQNIGNWDVSNVLSMENIFDHATSFNQSLENWSIISISAISLNSCGMSCENFSRTIHGWATYSNVNYGITLDATGLTYSSECATDYSYLTTELQWAISGISPTIGVCTDVITNEYITVWDTQKSGVTDSYKVEVPANGRFIYSYVELDPNFNPITGTEGNGDNANGNIIIFSQPGIYQISISPDYGYVNSLDRINFNNQGDKLKLLRIDQWGNFIIWSTFQNAYYGCANLNVIATDVPKLTNVTNTSYAFAETGLTTIPNFNNWDLTRVTNMSFMFKGVAGFVPDVENWDVSNVTDMSHMFEGSSNFNQDLSGWDVSNVTDMSYMFAGASSFTNMGPAEGEIHAKNNDIGGWDVGQVVNMEGMFAGAAQFNGDIGGWDVGQVVNMANMFDGAAQFDKDIGGWDVGQLGMGVTQAGNNISFANSGMSCENYSLTLQGWANQTGTALNVYLDATGMSFSPDILPDRSVLVNDKNWIILGDNKDDNCFLSIKELETPSFTIYPNPTQDQFTITGLSGYETIQLVDMTGRVLQTINNHNQTEESIQVNQLANGVYNLVISTVNGQRVINKLVKQ